MRVVHRHQSFNARIARENPDAVRATLAEHRAACSVLTGTEANHSRWDGLLKAEDWATFREPGPRNSGDPFVSYDVRRHHLIAGWVRPLSFTEYDGRLAWAAIAVLEHRATGVPVAYICTHLPAHVGRLFRIRRSSAWERAYREAMDSLRGQVKHMRDEHPERRIVLVGDLNLDVRKTFTRNLYGDTFRGTGLEFAAARRRERGSHRSRLIDWALTDLESRGEVLSLTDASDHRGVAFIHED